MTAPTPDRLDEISSRDSLMRRATDESGPLVEILTEDLETLLAALRAYRETLMPAAVETKPKCDWCGLLGCCQDAR